MTEASYTFRVVKFEVVQNDYSVFMIKVAVQPFNITFHIKDRYSGIETWQSTVKNSLQNPAGLPNFPKKKWFGNLERDFLQRRSGELEMFLNMFLKHPEVLTSKLVPVYFNEKALEPSDKQSIEDLVMHIQSKKPRAAPVQ